MIWDPSLRKKVYVVDASPEDYQSFQADSHGDQEYVFFATGREALRANDQESPSMWIINLRLPDMDGSDLQSLLRSRDSKATVALVGDEYRVDDELEARCAGADLYFAKPLQRDLVAAI